MESRFKKDKSKVHQKIWFAPDFAPVACTSVFINFSTPELGDIGGHWGTLGVKGAVLSLLTDSLRPPLQLEIGTITSLLFSSRTERTFGLLQAFAANISVPFLDLKTVWDTQNCYLSKQTGDATGICSHFLFQSCLVTIPYFYNVLYSVKMNISRCQCLKMSPQCLKQWDSALPPQYFS